MSEQYPPARPVVARMALFCLLAGVLTAGLLFPVVGGVGAASNRASESVSQGSADIVGGDVPAVSTMVDAAGRPIAWLYTQRRFEVPSDRIADTMKLAIVSIEDKRYADHNGVDLQGTLTGLAGFLKGAVDSRGAERRGAHEKRLPTAAAPVAHVERRIARIAQPLIGGREVRSARARCLDDGARDGARGDAEGTRVCRPVGAKPVAPRLRILGR